MAIKSFKDLEVWQKSMVLVTEIYRVTSELPQKEVYSLANQIQRASISIPSNIAEGSKRSSRADFRQFCMVALGSAAEVETQLLIIKQLYPLINLNNTLEEAETIQKMLTSLCKKLKDPINQKQ